MANVLLVDDDAAILEIASEFLEAVKHTVVSAPDATTAISLAQATDRLHVGIIDMVLPDGSGFELIQRIQEIHPGIPIIAMSGYLSDESASVHETLEALHVTRFLAKPFGQHDFLSAVRNALEEAPR